MKRIIKEFVQWLAEDFLDDFFAGILEAVELALNLLWKIIKALFWLVLAIGTIELWIIPFAFWLFYYRNKGGEQEDERE